MCLLLALVFQGFFLQWPLTVLMKQTRQAVRAFEQSILLRCLLCRYIKFRLPRAGRVVQNVRIFIEIDGDGRQFRLTKCLSCSTRCRPAADPSGAADP
jgi:hypothetical protein